MNVRKLSSLPAPLLQPLLLESEREGFRFVIGLLEEAERGALRLTAHGAGVFSAFRQDALVGVCALTRDPYEGFYEAETRRGLRLGRVRHLYVLRAYRRRGVGRGLLEALLQEAPAYYDTLTLRTDRADAAAFYKAFGFMRVAWPNTTHLLPLGRAV